MIWTPRIDKGIHQCHDLVNIHHGNCNKIIHELTRQSVNPVFRYACVTSRLDNALSHGHTLRHSLSDHIWAYRLPCKNHYNRKRDRRHGPSQMLMLFRHVLRTSLQETRIYPYTQIEHKHDAKIWEVHILLFLFCLYKQTKTIYCLNYNSHSGTSINLQKIMTQHYGSFLQNSIICF